jgi:transposase
MLWCLRRVFIRAPTGRQRFNVLGALNAVTHELISVNNVGSVDSWSVIQLFFEIRKRRDGRPITLVLDNARYQRNYLVQRAAKWLGIELLFLPPYSPNLNLIERYWKFVKKKVLYNKYYETFDDFMKAIADLTENAHVRHHSELASLLTHNFQNLEPQLNQAA